VDDGVQVAEIAVDGAAFEPAAVGLSPGVPARLVITRTDAPTCVDSIAAPELGIETKAVSVDVPVILEFTPETGGTFTLACGMDMVTARLVVRS
jgi:plastocyanin domain-containing protein